MASKGAFYFFSIFRFLLALLVHLILAFIWLIVSWCLTSLRSSFCGWFLLWLCYYGEWSHAGVCGLLKIHTPLVLCGRWSQAVSLLIPRQQKPTRLPPVLRYDFPARRLSAGSSRSDLEGRDSGLGALAYVRENSHAHVHCPLQSRATTVFQKAFSL